MAQERELIVWMENKPGNLAKLGKALKKKNVNIRAILASGKKGQAPVHLLLDKLAEGREALSELGFELEERKVVVAELDNQPGALSDIAGRISAKGVNIDYAYFSAPDGQSRALIVLGIPEASAVEGLL